jgi:hypothetical protein
VVIGFSDETECGVAILDSKTAAQTWKSSDEAKDVSHPKEVAVKGETVVVTTVG